MRATSSSERPSTRPVIRTANGAANACAELAPPGRDEPGEQVAGLGGDRAAEQLADLPQPERPLERRPQAGVLLPVGGQHHRPERGPDEVLLGLDGEAEPRAQHLPHLGVARHEPAAEGRHPRDRLGLAQPVERLLPARLLEVGELDRGADRKPLAPGRVLCGRDLGLLQHRPLLLPGSETL